jgi:hypothetical protein
MSDDFVIGLVAIGLLLAAVYNLAESWAVFNGYLL